jgi:hypothetical protein
MAVIALAKSVKQALGRIGKSSRFETNNRKVHRLCRSHGIEEFAEEHDLAACNSQKDNVILAIGAPGSLDDTLRLDFGDSAFRIGERIYLQIEETEIVYRFSEPRNVTQNLLSPRQPCRMAERRCIGEFPQNIVGDQCLPLGSIINEGFDMSLQKAEAIVFIIGCVGSPGDEV